MRAGHLPFEDLARVAGTCTLALLRDRGCAHVLDRAALCVDLSNLDLRVPRTSQWALLVANKLVRRVDRGAWGELHLQIDVAVQRCENAWPVTTERRSAGTLHAPLLFHLVEREDALQLAAWSVVRATRAAGLAGRHALLDHDGGLHRGRKIGSKCWRCRSDI